MKRNLHVGLVLSLLLAILLASSMFPAVVQADYHHGTPWPHRTPFGTWESPEDSATPTPQESQPAPTQVVNPTDDSPTPTAGVGTPTPDVGATDVGPTPTLTDSAATPGATEDGSSALPEGTPVVVLDADGNQVSLATNEAAEIIASGDPIWCPVGHLPGDAECVEAATVTALVTALSSATGGGTVYFMATYATPDATFDGTDPSLAGLTDLTIQGGWNGLYGAAYDLSGSTEFSTSLSIINWDGDVTLNDLVFSNTGSDGVTVSTTGDIELDNVQSSGNSGSGAQLDNTSGGSGVQVNVSGSSFRDNATGLTVVSDGDVTLVDIDASYNSGTGAAVQAGGDVEVGQSNFSWNGLYGLNVDAGGDVYLVSTNAINNGSTGSLLASGGDLTIDSSSFDLNAGSGLDAQAADSIWLTAVQASGNDDAGVTLNAGRDATLTDVEASQNGAQGAAVWADWNITVDSSEFVDNGGDGAYLRSVNSDISVDCSTFEDNGGYGVNADTHELLDLSGDTFDGNDDGDYNITSGGTVLVRGGDNCDTGASAEESAPTATPTAILPLNVIRVVEGEAVTLDCTRYSGTVLILPNGDQVILPCPITGDATLEAVFSEDLPAPLDPGLTFLSGMRLQVAPGLYGIVTVDFVVPFNQDVTNLSILRWDETGWTDLGGIRSGEIYFEARSSQDGVFVLVTQ